MFLEDYGLSFRAWGLTRHEHITKTFEEQVRIFISRGIYTNLYVELCWHGKSVVLSNRTNIWHVKVKPNSKTWTASISKLDFTGLMETPALHEMESNLGYSFKQIDDHIEVVGIY